MKKTLCHETVIIKEWPIRLEQNGVNQSQSMKPAHYTQLEDHESRSIAHMAARARCDTIGGGALALVYGKRLERMGSRLNLLAVASDVYSRSTGRHSREFEAWECPECGCVHLGQDNAAKCCANVD